MAVGQPGYEATLRELETHLGPKKNETDHSQSTSRCSEFWLLNLSRFDILVKLNESSVRVVPEEVGGA